MSDTSSGFTQATFNFLRDLREHNDKPWFEAHKSDYRDHVLLPLQALAAALAYKTSHWITFKRPRTDWQHYPAFFFEISQESYRYGMGFFNADRDTMGALRERIEAEPIAFRTCIAFHAFHAGQDSRHSPFAIEGETYKRPMKAGLPPNLDGLADWFHRKNLYLVCHRAVDREDIGPELKDDLIAGFKTLTPLYHFLAPLPRR